MGQVQDQGGLGTSGTQPPGPNHASGTHGFLGLAWSSATRQPTTRAIQLACRTAVIIFITMEVIIRQNNKNLLVIYLLILLKIAHTEGLFLFSIFLAEHILV